VSINPTVHERNAGPSGQRSTSHTCLFLQVGVWSHLWSIIETITYEHAAFGSFRLRDHSAGELSAANNFGVLMSAQIGPDPDIRILQEGVHGNETSDHFYAREEKLFVEKATPLRKAGRIPDEFEVHSIIGQYRWHYGDSGAFGSYSFHELAFEQAMRSWGFMAR
jgi:hypothetical protein